MHSCGLRIPGLGEGTQLTELLRTAARLSAPDQRTEAAAELARAIGGTGLLIFIRDHEINTFVAAPGFRAWFPSGKLWTEFLAECVRKGEHTAALPYERTDDVRPVVGIAPGPDSVLVLVGTDRTDNIDWLRELLPLFTAMFRGEQAAVVASAHAQMAADSAARTEAMAAILKQSRMQLEEALASAEGARNSAVEANRVKSQFLATMSHELRTPLNAIGGYSQLLAIGIHGPVTPEQKETLSRIDRSQRQLLGLINDILNLARLEAGKIDYEMKKVDVKEMMHDISPMIEPQLLTKDIRYQVRVPPGICVHADQDKLEQILLNLLSNAVKFTEPGGTITVETETDAIARIVQISVSDTGRGIPPEKLDTIFEPFIQVDASHSRTEQGAGLGLTISRDLARGMGGDIKVSSKLGKGATFVVSVAASD